ncbi:MAG: hypothetical protein GX938_09400 [Spirochaetales bacterium]|nr:hypothetical protein [Spirochaetales bacterium]
MKKIVKIGETERRARLDTDHDILIYDSRAGRDSTRWTRLYAHKCRGGEIVFYEAYYTLWADERNSIDVVDIEEARERIEENYDDLADGMTDEALAELGLLEPDALE